MRPLLALLCVSLLAEEPYRPAFHFSPARNWTNDPCGLVFHDGEYHLFFQHNPFGTQWGHMSWGHAVSPDGIRWTELPVAIPEGDGTMIFTGSAVVDRTNSSGLCEGGRPCLVAVYTGHTPAQKRQTQNLAVSNDRGRTWVKHRGNPVLDLQMEDFRDPKVLWVEATKRWVMVVALPKEYKVRLYGSPDLKAWSLLSEFGPAGATGGIWECPELFELPVEGSRESRWVLKIGINPGHIAGGSGEQYFVGTFDGTRFVNENPREQTLWLDHGRDCYCALSFNGQPRTLLAWMSNWLYAGKVPTQAFRGQMTLPREMALRRTPDGLRLLQRPVSALAKRHGQRTVIEAKTAAEMEAHLQRHRVPGRLVDLDATLRPGAATRVGWTVLAGPGAETVIGYDVKAGQLFVDRTKSGNVGFSAQFPSRTTAPLALRDGALRLRIVVDRASVEVFADDGLVAITNLAFPPEGAAGLHFFAEGGEIAHARVEAWEVRE